MFTRNYHKNQKTYLIDQSALIFTEQAYCVVIVKKDIVHLYFYILSIQSL